MLPMIEPISCPWLLLPRIAGVLEQARRQSKSKQAKGRGEGRNNEPRERKHGKQGKSEIGEGKKGGGLGDGIPQAEKRYMLNSCGIVPEPRRSVQRPRIAAPFAGNWPA